MPDILNKRVLEIDDQVFFARATAEEPSIYVRFRGVVQRVYTLSDRVHYHIKVEQVLETLEFSKDYIHGKSFRVVMAHGNYSMIKMYNIFDIMSANDFSSAFVKKFEKHWHEVPMILCYETKEELDIQVTKICSHLLQKLSVSIQHLQKVYSRLNT